MTARDEVADEERFNVLDQHFRELIPWYHCDYCLSELKWFRTRYPTLVAEVRELRQALKELLAGTFEGTSDNLIRMEKARVLLARHEEGARD